MDNQNLQNLQKIAKIFQPENIITTQEIDQVLKGILEILATYKKGTEQINTETKQVVNTLLEQVIESNKQALEGSKLIVDERSNELEALLKDVKQMISDVEILASSVEDGKDADEEKIVEDVISRIKIDPTVVTVSAQEIKDKLASLEGDNKLDISSIKGFDLYSTKVDLDYAVKTLQHQTSTLLNRSSVRSIVAGTNITVDNTDPSNPVISSTGSGGSIAIGDSITSATAGSILFAGASGVLAQDNSNFFYDDTNNRLGLLTSAPTHSLTLASTSTGIALYNTSDKTTNYERLVTSVSTNIFNILTQYGGSAASRQLNIGLAGTAGSSTPSRYLGIGGGSATVGRFAFYDTTSSAQAFISTNLSNSASSGQSTTVLINPTFTQTGTASYTALLVNPTEITLGNGTKSLLSLQVGSVERFGVLNTGATTITGTPGSSTAYTGLLIQNTSSGIGANTIISLRAASISTGRAEIHAVAPGGSDTELAFYTSDNNAAATEKVRIGANGTTTITNFVDAASNQVLVLQGDRATPANDDSIYQSFFLSSSTGVQREYARLIVVASDVTNASEDGYFQFQTMLNGSLGNRARLTSTYFEPTSNDGIALGTSARSFSDLFLASGGVINWNNGNATLTHSTGLITSSVPVASPQIYNADQAATVTTNAGTITKAFRNNTFTNTSAATMTITLSTTGAVGGDMLLVQVYDFSAAAQTITWVNTENSDVTVPATSNGSTTLPRTIGFKWNPSTSKWRCIANV